VRRKLAGTLMSIQ